MIAQVSLTDPQSSLKAPLKVMRMRAAGTLNYPNLVYQEHPLMAKEDLHRCWNAKNQGIKAQIHHVLWAVLHHYYVSPH